MSGTPRAARLGGQGADEGRGQVGEFQAGDEVRAPPPG